MNLSFCYPCPQPQLGELGRVDPCSCRVQTTLMVWSLPTMPDSHAQKQRWILPNSERESRFLLLYKSTTPLFYGITKALGICCSFVSDDLCQKHLTVKSQGEWNVLISVKLLDLLTRERCNGLWYKRGDLQLWLYILLQIPTHIYCWGKVLAQYAFNLKMVFIPIVQRCFSIYEELNPEKDTLTKDQDEKPSYIIKILKQMYHI